MPYEQLTLGEASSKFTVALIKPKIMTGQIIKRGENTWYIRIFLGRDANGKRKYFNKTIHGTKKDAQKFLTAKTREKDLGVFFEPASISLNEYLDKWLAESAKPRLREATLDRELPKFIHFGFNTPSACCGFILYE